MPLVPDEKRLDIPAFTHLAASSIPNSNCLLLIETEQSMEYRVAYCFIKVKGKQKCATPKQGNLHCLLKPLKKAVEVQASGFQHF